MKIYNEPYFNKNAWLLKNFDKLNISNDEILVLLLINFYNENNLEIKYEDLAAKLGINTNKLDEIFADLTSKHYLHIDVNEKGIAYSIDEVFEFDVAKYEEIENEDIYKTLEDFLSKPLTPIERMKVSDLLNTYDENSIFDAVRIAEGYRKYNLAYVESILRNEKR